MAADSLHTQPLTPFGIPAPTPAPRSLNPPAQFVDNGVCTAIFDSVLADTVTGRIPHFATETYRDSVAVDLLADTIAAHTVVGVDSGFTRGIVGESRPDFPSGGGILTAILMLTLAATALNGQSVLRALRAYCNELTGYRRRNNAFDDNTRVHLPTAFLLALAFIVFGGVVLYNINGRPATASFSGTTAAMGILGLYYLFQIVVYSLIGYSFSSPEGRRQWVQGFAASSAIAGLALAAPALLIVCRPEWTTPMLWLSAAIYAASRAVFVVKGFKIFYHKLRSLLYFILYLCTLEIIPVLLIYRLLCFLTVVV